MNAPIPEHSLLPWRSVYPLGSKQRCAAVASNDHYVFLYVAEPDATDSTVRMHQANADLIVHAQERIADLEAQLKERCDELQRVYELVNHWSGESRSLEAQNRQLRDALTGCSHGSLKAGPCWCSHDHGMHDSWCIEARAALAATEPEVKPRI